MMHTQPHRSSERLWASGSMDAQRTGLHKVAVTNGSREPWVGTRDKGW